MPLNQAGNANTLCTRQNFAKRRVLDFAAIAICLPPPPAPPPVGEGLFFVRGEAAIQIEKSGLVARFLLLIFLPADHRRRSTSRRV